MNETVVVLIAMAGFALWALIMCIIDGSGIRGWVDGYLREQWNVIKIAAGVALFMLILSL